MESLSRIDKTAVHLRSSFSARDDFIVHSTKIATLCSSKKRKLKKKIPFLFSAFAFFLKRLEKLRQIVQNKTKQQIFLYTFYSFHRLIYFDCMCCFEELTSSSPPCLITLCACPHLFLGAKKMCENAAFCEEGNTQPHCTAAGRAQI